MMRYFSICFYIFYACNILIGQIDFAERSLQYNVLHQMNEWSVGTGISIYDFNQDGLDDLSFGTERGRVLGFYVNKGARFEQVELVDNTEEVKQILWADYDNDGDPDLYVAAFDGINRLYKNKGNLEFQEITEFAGLPLETHRGFGAIFGDYNRDGWLDLYYVSRDIPGSENFLNRNRLFKNLADGTFSEVTDEVNVADAGKTPFCAGFIDYNNDMWPDIYIANDKYSQNALLENTQNGIFRDIGASSKSDIRMNAMCVNAEDFNNDGWTDIYITNTTEGSVCLLNSGASSELDLIEFTNVADTLGISYAGNTGWGSVFVDVDNDTDLDLFVSGSVHEGSAPEVKSSSVGFFENINGGESFEQPEIPALQKDTTFSYANAIGDINDDGYADIIVQNNTPDRFFIWENFTPRRNTYLKLKLEGVKSNRDGVGSRISCFTDQTMQTTYTRLGSSFLGQSSATKIFGCGTNTIVDSLIVTWSSGHIDKLYDIATNQTLTIIEGSTTEGEINLAPGIDIVEGDIKSNTDDPSISNQISISPNPTSDFLSIETGIRLRSIKIIDIQGRELINRQLSERTNQKIRVTDLKTGFYLARFYTADDKVTTIRWVKI